MAGLLVWLPPAAAMPAPAQEGPRYHPLQLDCAGYRQQAQASILLASGRQRSRERTGRDGVLVLRAAAADSSIRLEAWFDTLSVWREGSGERLEPDTDGLIGGRYRGVLTALGVFSPTEIPFLPDEIQQVADLSGALADLLPPLPPIRLDPGGSWRDQAGAVIITRLPDGSDAGRRVERYRLVRRGTTEEQRLLPDSTEVQATRSESESGVYDWSEELGLVRWDRDITEDVTVPAGGPVKQPFQTRIEQKVSVERVVVAGCR